MKPVEQRFWQYVLKPMGEGYRPPSGIRTYRSKHTGAFVVQTTTRGSIQAQLTKRTNRIDAEYSAYCQMWHEEQKRIASYKPLPNGENHYSNTLKIL